MKTRLLEVGLVLCILGVAYTAGMIVGDLLYKQETQKHKINKLYSVVRLVNNDKTFCSGTVVSPNTILTAAHCVTLDSEFGPVEYRKDINIRPSDNTELGILANVYSVRSQMDQAILRGDFRLFSTRKVVSDVGELTILRSKTALTACGYPMGGALFCGKLIYKEPDNFYWKASGVLIPGMSGGPTFAEDGSVVATNVAVTGAFSIISPTYDIDVDILRGDK